MKEKIILICFIVLVTVSCSKGDNCSAVDSPNCICPEIYDPVCGCDNVTYSSSC